MVPLRALLVFALAVTVLAVDQVSKYLVAAWLPRGQSVPVLPGFFYITHSMNPGAAFGLLPHQRGLFVAITLLVLGMIVAFLWRERHLDRGMAVALGLTLGGAAGNLVDRVRWGAVVDFLDFRVWPVFNLADVAIVCGAALIGVLLLRPAPADRRLG